MSLGPRESSPSGMGPRSTTTPALESSLYFQCAAMPYSARRCIANVRICSLDRLAGGADHRRVQRLVHVEFRHRDEVLEPAGDRIPPGVDDAEDRVAVADRLDQDTDAHQVVDVGEVAPTHDHLLVDRVVVLGPAGDRGLELCPTQVALHLVDHRSEVVVARGGALGHQADDLVVHLGMQCAEGEVLELPLDRVHAQPVGQRRVDLQGLAGLAARGVLGHVAPGAGVVQTVGKLDHQDPDVLGHRDDHLADGLGLRRLAVLDLVELGDAVDEHGHLVAELVAQVAQVVVGVLDGVVQERGREGRRGHAQLGQDGRHRERMGDVGVAALALLAAVGACGRPVGALDDPDVGLRVGGMDRAEQRLEGRVGRVALRRQAGKPRPHADGRRRAGGGDRLLCHGPPRGCRETSLRGFGHRHTRSKA